MIKSVIGILGLTAIALTLWYESIPGTIVAVGATLLGMVIFGSLDDDNEYDR